ncbi:MAG: hypothetical protein ACR2J8_08635 [Thermomicrobiales bacterium]
MSVTTERAQGSGLLNVARWLSIATAALVLVQAFMIGQVWFMGRGSLLLTHGIVGNVSYIGALGMVVVGYLGLKKGWGMAFLGLAILVVLLMTAQLGLGYVGRKVAMAASIHVFNGVLLTGTLFALMTVAWLRPGGSR